MSFMKNLSLTSFRNRLFSAVVMLLTMVAYTGCITKEQVALFQDADEYLDPKRIATTYDIRIQADDQLSIAIASQDRELVEVFNNKTIIGAGPNGSRSSAGSSNSGLGASAPLEQSFHVDNDGYIEFPVFGRLRVEGLSRKAVADTIQNRLRSGYINDAVVDVELLSFHVVVIGGVQDESILTINKDRCTIIEALTMAGGFKAGGYRENVVVIREENGEVWTYRVDCTRLADLINSPVYYLQQNDIVYVDTNGVDLIEHSAGFKYLSAISTVVTFIVSISALLVAMF